MAALALLEPASEALTLAFGGLILLLVLAVPTIRAPLQEDWLKVSNVAACLFDQFCDPIGAGQLTKAFRSLLRIFLTR
ncbi:hypothetical protein [Bradyrhizobium sp. Ec3.3]|uniref:hypothetical protein n=1 Tax=Bradyrhizobium sp. Ec3.3 TaxID=189753 RepID=UPI0004824689|nr:hypothetical protein [Bradyrhizobium sp. Ec3.3]